MNHEYDRHTKAGAQPWAHHLQTQTVKGGDLSRDMKGGQAASTACGGQEEESATDEDGRLESS